MIPSPVMTSGLVVAALLLMSIVGDRLLRNAVVGSRACNIV
jgi:hypothetical protein